MTKKDALQQIDDAERRAAKYQPVARTLRELYGDLRWTPSQPPMDELISCILSQSTSDTNRDRGFAALKKRYPSWEAVVSAPEAELVETIRSAGLANQKAPRIQEALRYVYDERGEYAIDFLQDIPIDEAKAWLTRMKGIGPKTAAIVLCFAFGLPAFPVDTHVDRVSKRLGFIPQKLSVNKAHDVMEAIVPPEDYYAFHIYLIRHGRDTCNARSPQCGRCPLTAHCDHYRREYGEPDGR
ncbi:MAG: endonuclease III [Anaerolineaceae bacterium]|nr:MAG: endonuclease III [Anaerolineaceae bacterium]